MNTKFLNGLMVRVFFMLLTGVSILGAQTEVTLNPVKDNTLYEDAAGALSNGKGIHLFAGKTAAKNAGKVRRALLQFDVAGQISAGSTIQSAVLSLFMSKTISGNQTVSLHKVGAEWGEGSSDASGTEGQGGTATTGDATWIHRMFNSNTWSIAGGDFSPTVSATQSVGDNGSYTWGSTSEMVADVQSWLDNTGGNFGWILVGNESAFASTKRFFSREYGSENYHPKLTIVYAAPTGVLSTSDGVVPETFVLEQNFPNPFNPNTVIHFALPRSVNGIDLQLDIFNMIGQKVRILVNSPHAAGRYSVQWDGRDETGKLLSGGVYFYRLRAGSFVDLKRMVLLR